jgi:hypothetical protein
MRNSQLFHIFSALSKKEVRELRKWLLSPIHNQRDDVYQLFEYLSQHLGEEKDKLLTKERLFAKIFPKETFDDARLRQTMHFLQTAIEEYFFYIKIREEPFRETITLVNVYHERKLDKLYEKAIKKLEDEYEAFPFKDDEHLEKGYLIVKEKSNRINEKTRATKLHYQEMSDSLENTFIARKIKLACVMLSHQRVYKTEYDLGLIDALMEYVSNKKELLDIPIIKVYYHLYNLFRYPNEETHYFEMKQALKGYNRLFKPAERSDLHLIAINYCIGKMNTGVQKFLREAFEMYQEGIESHFLIINGVLNHLDFRNIVSIGTTLKEFDWVSNFIEQYQQYLAPDYRDNFVQFSLCKLYFEMGHYDKAQSLLIQFDIDDLLINLSAKSMLVRIYYELNEINALESLLDSLRTYVNRNKAIAYHKNNVNLLIRYMKKLTKLNTYDKDHKEKLREELVTAPSFPEKNWILKQLDAL